MCQWEKRTSNNFVWSTKVKIGGAAVIGIWPFIGSLCVTTLHGYFFFNNALKKQEEGEGQEKIENVRGWNQILQEN